MNLKNIKIGIVLFGLVLGLGVGINVNAEDELITNGGFESGSTNWNPYGNFYADSCFTNAYNGSGYAYVSNLDGTPGNSLVGWIYQNVTIPSDITSATLSFYYNITSQETGSSSDILNVTIQNSTGGYLGNVVLLSSLDKASSAGNPYYTKKTFDLTSYKGQTIRVNFLATTNSSLPTTFRLDDVSITVNTASSAAPTFGVAALSNEIPICDHNIYDAPAVRLNWDPADGATSYHVYRNGSLYENVATDLTFYNSANITAGQTYTYYIQARNSSGYTNSNTVSVYVPSNICGSSPPPSTKPGNFILSNQAPICDHNYPEGPAIMLDWTNSAGATKYEVYRNGSYYTNTLLDSYFYNSANLFAGNNYSYYIKAVNAYGYTNSNTVSVYVPSDICDSSPPPYSNFEIDFSQIDYGNVMLNTQKIISGDLFFDPPVSYEPTIRNNSNSDVNISIYQDDMGLGFGNVKYSVRIGNSSPWTYYDSNEIVVLESTLQALQTNSINFGILVNNFSPWIGNYQGILTVNGIEINTQLSRTVGGGSSPVIIAKWEMNGPYTNLSGTDDDLIWGAQFNQTGKNIAICAIATDPDGVADISGVYASIYYPEEEYESFVEEISLSQLSKQDGMDLFCNNIRSFNSNLPAFNTYPYSYTYDEICSINGMLMTENSYVYCGDIDLSLEDPSGDYSVNVFAYDKSGLFVVFQNFFSVRTSVPAYCGNGIIETGEQCDGVNLGGQTCASFGFDGGSLNCNDSCQIITSGCNNNVIEIKDNSTGGECSLIGSWDVVNKICLLSQDLNQGIIINSDNIILNGNGYTIMGSGEEIGVYLYERNNVIIKNLNVENFKYGIHLVNSNNNRLEGNTANSNRIIGILLSYSDNNILASNISSYNDAGIRIENGLNNTLTGNMTKFNDGTGINLVSSSGNLITENIINSNGKWGVFITNHSGSSNNIYLNNFTNNIVNAYTHSFSNNNWNSPEPITYTYSGDTYTSYLGNYYDNYTDVDINDNGIWDNPYVINENNQDSYSLKLPFENYKEGGSNEEPGSFSIISADTYCDTQKPVGPAVRLEWSKSIGATSYELYRDEVLYIILPAEQLSFINNIGLIAEENYIYKVKAVNDVGSNIAGEVEVNISSDICENSILPQCSDGVDNDGDGLIDMADSRCDGPEDNDESGEKRHVMVKGDSVYNSGLMLASPIVCEAETLDHISLALEGDTNSQSYIKDLFAYLPWDYQEVIDYFLKLIDYKETIPSNLPLQIVPDDHGRTFITDENGMGWFYVTNILSPTMTGYVSESQFEEVEESEAPFYAQVQNNGGIIFENTNKEKFIQFNDKAISVNKNPILLAGTYFKIKGAIKEFQCKENIIDCDTLTEQERIDKGWGLFGSITKNKLKEILGLESLDSLDDYFSNIGVFKIIPNDWVLEVINTHSNSIVLGGSVWWEVKDKTDGLTGWIAFRNNNDEKYLHYDDNKQKQEEWEETTINLYQIKILQKILNRLENDEGAAGYWALEGTEEGSYGKETNTFGPLTKGALKRFQESNGLAETGEINQRTEDKLNSLWKEKHSSRDETGRYYVLNKIRFDELRPDLSKDVFLEQNVSTEDYFYLKGDDNDNHPFADELIDAITGAEGAKDDNEILSFDCGRGIGQITDNSWVGAYSGVNCYCGTGKNYMPYEKTKLVENVLDSVKYKQEKDDNDEYLVKNTSLEFDGNEYKFYRDFENIIDGVSYPRTGYMIDMTETFSESKDYYWHGIYRYKDTEKYYGVCKKCDTGNCSCNVYTNTLLGFMANIQDKYNVLNDYYHDAIEENKDTNIGGDLLESVNEELKTTYDQVEVRKAKAQVGATWRYNHGNSPTDDKGDPRDDSTGYLEIVNGYLENPNNEKEVKLLSYIMSNYKEFEIRSPVDMQIQDTEGNVTGVVNGQIVESIPSSIYDEETERVLILFPKENYTSKIVGTSNGTYGFIVASVVNSEKITFIATDIPTTPNEVHQFSISWQALSQGEKGVTIKINKDGDDEFETEIITDATMEPPTADIGESYESTEGAEIIFDASQSTDADGSIDLYEWDFDGDGNYDESSTSPTMTYTYGDDYSGEVILRVTDDEGLTDVDTADVNIINANPEIDVFGDQTIEVLDEFVFENSFTDAGWLDTHDAKIEWGDGTEEDISLTEENEFPGASGKIIGLHTYDISGIYTVILYITDDDGGVGTDKFEITVEKRKTELVYTGDLNGQYSDEVTLQAILTDKMGGVEGKTVNFNLGGQFVSADTNSEGIAEIKITLNEIPGIYEIETSFQGDEFYLSSSDSDEFEIMKDDTILSIPNGEIVYSDDATIQVTLQDDENKFLLKQIDSQKTVYLEYFNGSEWKFITKDALYSTDNMDDTDDTLDLYFQIPDNFDEIAGNYDLRARFSGDTYYNETTSETGNLEILKEDTILSDPSVTVTYSDSSTLEITFQDNDGETLFHQSDEPKTVYLEVLDGIEWKILSEDSLNSVDNSDKTLTFTFEIQEGSSVDLSAGDYDLRVRFDGDLRYNSTVENGILTIVKEAVVITVKDQEGFFGEEVILEATILDDDGEKLFNDPNKVIFSVGGNVVGEAEIDANGKAEISWVINYIPTNSSEIYPIVVSFTENEYYLSGEGQGEFIAKSAKQLKQDTLAKLKTITTDNKQAKKEIDKAIEDVEDSLDSELWTDSSRLDEQQGHKVFDREKQAIKSLLKIIEEKGKHEDPEIADELQGVINDLVKVDILLTKVAIYDAESIESDDTDLQKKIDDEINKAKEDLEKALQELADDNPNKAIDYLKKAWKSAQLAIDFLLDKTSRWRNSFENGS